jgi:hypothetical protein
MVPRSRRPVRKKTPPGDTESKVVRKAAQPPRPESFVPVVLDAGSRSRASIRRLKKGTGSLMREVRDVVQVMKSASGKPVRGPVPIVIVYREKRRSRSFFTSPLDFFF